MKDWIKKDKIVLKIGSFEWLNYFGLPTGFIGFSLIEIYFFLIETNHQNAITLLIGFLLSLILGVGTYWVQLKRLNFSTFVLNKEIEVFKKEIRELLNNNEWEIDYDNQAYLQATYKGSSFNLDMLTIKFRRDKIQWNVIHHPQSHNSISALFTTNRYGRKMIEKIKACA